MLLCKNTHRMNREAQREKSSSWPPPAVVVKMRKRYTWKEDGVLDDVEDEFLIAGFRGFDTGNDVALSIVPGPKSWAWHLSFEMFPPSWAKSPQDEARLESDFREELRRGGIRFARVDRELFALIGTPPTDVVCRIRRALSTIGGGRKVRTMRMSMGWTHVSAADRKASEIKRLHRLQVRQQKKGKTILRPSAS
jgi:hypothetical protein